MQNKGLVIIPKPQMQAKLKSFFNSQAGKLESDILFLVRRTPEREYQQRSTFVINPLPTVLIQSQKNFDFAVVFNGNNKELLIVFPKAVNYMRLTFKYTLTNKLDILHMISKQGSELFFWGQALQ